MQWAVQDACQAVGVAVLLMRERAVAQEMCGLLLPDDKATLRCHTMYMHAADE